jgi:hypothetical protein
VLDSVSDIVRGNVSSVVNKINDVLGQMVPIIIGFLASLIGLGGIGQKIREIVEKLQKPVNKALDFVIKTGLKLAGPIIRGISGIAGKVKAKVAAGKAWVKGKVEAGKAWAKEKVYGGDDSPEGKQKRLEKSVRAGVSAANRFAGKAVGARVLGPMLSAIRMRYGVAVLEPVERGPKWAVRGEVQRMEETTDVPTKGIVPIGVDPRTVIVKAQGVLDAQRKAGSSVAVAELTTFIATGESRVAKIESSAHTPDNKALEKDKLARELGADLVAIGQKHRLGAIGSYGEVGMSAVEINRLVYEVINTVRGMVTRRRQAAGETEQPGEDLQNAFDRVIRQAASRYEAACQAIVNRGVNPRSFKGNLFTFGGNTYFVDHDANYLLPDDEVGASRGTFGGRMYVSSTPVIPDLDTLSSDPKRELIDNYRYRHTESVAQFRSLAVTIATGGSIPVKDGAYFAAAMIAEARRNPNAHVTNLLLLSQDSNVPFTMRAPMTGGGTATESAAKDPTLKNVPGAPRQPGSSTSAQPRTEVTDQEIALVRRSYEQEMMSTVEVMIKELGRQPVKLNMINFLNSRTRPVG